MVAAERSVVATEMSVAAAEISRESKDGREGDAERRERRRKVEAQKGEREEGGLLAVVI
jgi:type III secretory pathway component EscU